MVLGSDVWTSREWRPSAKSWTHGRPQLRSDGMDAEQNIEPDAIPRVPRAGRLTDRQRDVLDAFAREGDQAAALYHGALRVLDDADNPVRMRLAACGLREVLDAFQDAPRPKDLKVRVKELKGSWEIAQRSGSSKAFEDELPGFFTAFEEDYPQRREQASKIIDGLDPSGQTAPPAVSQARGKRWMDLSGYFSNVLHGNIRPVDEEFSAKREAFEQFFLDLFRPSTFVDFAQLDALITGGAPDE